MIELGCVGRGDDEEAAGVAERACEPVVHQRRHLAHERAAHEVHGGRRLAHWHEHLAPRHIAPRVGAAPRRPPRRKLRLDQARAQLNCKGILQRVGRGRNARLGAAVVG